MFFLLVPLHAAPNPPPPDWQSTLEKVVPAVVSIRVNWPRSFDTENASNTYATGFVVDAERGLIVSNRHVPGPGPFHAEAVFQDNEEVPLTLAYRDPIHDFSILHFDPKAVRYMPLVALPLYPEGATVGTEIRVVGNDAGQKLSFHAGTIARLDREAPDYGRGNYNDFNIFYIQAASGTTGGSSGSPVIDASGRAVALNAGGMNNSAAAYYFPLQRVQQALEAVRQGQSVPRGTLQTSFVQEPYDEARRLGLPEEVEAALRRSFPGILGVLVNRGALIGGPADGKLKAGDMLVGVEGAPLEGHVMLEAALDTHVGKPLHLRIVRAGKVMEVEVTPGDLYAVTPSEYLEVGGAVLHPLSLEQARNYGVPIRGIYVATPGYIFGLAGIGRGALLTHIDDQPLQSMDDLQKALMAHADGDRFTVRYFNLGDPLQRQIAFATMDRRWFIANRCRSVDWIWHCEALPPPPASAPPPPPQTTQFPAMDTPLLRKLAPSLVYIRFTSPFQPEGLYANSFRGTGVVVDATLGLVLTDRDTAPIALGDVRLTVAGSLEIPGRVVWVHPVHNLALIQYDPKRLGATPVREIQMDARPVKSGERIWEVGFTGDQHLVSRETRVSRISELNLPLPNPPFFRDCNLDTVVLEGASVTGGGLLVNAAGKMRAIWASFQDLSKDKPSGITRGIPSALVADTLRAARSVEGWPVLGVEFGSISLAEARQRGLSAERAAALEEHDELRQVLVVRRRNLATLAGSSFLEGDLLLTAGGHPVTRFSELEQLAWSPAFSVTVLRGRQEVPLPLVPLRVDGAARPRYIRWAGAIVQEIPLQVLQQQGISAKGVYVSNVPAGTPAARYRLSPTWRIQEVNGTPVSNLAEFQAAVSGLPDHSSVRVRTEDLDGLIRVITLELDLEFWPTQAYESRNLEWTLVPLQ